MPPATIVDLLLPLVENAFDRQTRKCCPILPSSAEAAIVLALTQKSPGSVVWILDGPQSLERAHRDLLTLNRDAQTSLVYFPAWETIPGQDTEADPDITGHRLTALSALASPNPARTLVATCVQALMQTVPAASRLERDCIRLETGMACDPEPLAKRLADGGYSFEPEVLQKSQAAMRGGILDIWPPTEPWPLRLEFLGPTVESIRTFSPADQTSVEHLEAATLPPAAITAAGKRPSLLLDYLADDTAFTWSDLDTIQEHAAVYDEVLAEAGEPSFAVTFDSLRRRLQRRAAAHQFVFAATPPRGHVPFPLDLEPVQGVVALPAQLMQPDIMEKSRQKFLAGLARRAAEGFTVHITFDTQGSLDHFSRQQTTAGSLFSPPADLSVGGLSSGFLSASARLVTVSESDLYGRPKTSMGRYDPLVSRPRAPADSGRRITELSHMEPGDLVVHSEHGVGRYLGLGEIEVTGKRQEVITVEYADEAKLHIPVSQSHLLSRYVGLARSPVRLHRLGGRRWNKERQRAEEAIADLAASLLETQAHRDALSGFAYPADTPWQHEFETAFPYRETRDQLRVIKELQDDMLSPHPMDRLICGDAGYGKTEVAMRAAFKAVMSGKQVAVLVPTTILAQQHYETFGERMASYPVRIEMLSRFRSAGMRSQTILGMSEGTVDIVIGTHALLQNGISFKDLGLVIIDEEQRFGVIHKERLKQMRKLVDVLTLTATPIPRTLYMSMTGARDMSLLQTPPSQRMAIQTVVAKNSDKVIREAILRELNREGQVFYLHNRILTIEKVRRRLNRLVPEARLEVAHGRMPSAELADVMHRFSQGDFDVLLCTTIIESGLDIPRANTILVDRADRFGIADLYQLRGRVGRSSHKAYAYLLLPADTHVDSDARQRITAVRKYSGLSAGFNLALRDLEIRGAGNLLGAQQSGHISAIGFGLYCQLLRRSVAQLKGEAPPALIDVEMRLDFISLSPAADRSNSAAIPYEYLDDEGLRLATYRRIAEAVEDREIDAIHVELTDRFGPLPPEAGRLLAIARLRLAAARAGIRHIETRGDKAMLQRGKDFIMINGRHSRLTSRHADGRLTELLKLVHDAPPE